MGRRSTHGAPTRVMRDAARLYKAGKLTEFISLAKSYGLTQDGMKELMQRYLDYNKAYDYGRQRKGRRKTMHIKTGHAVVREKSPMIPTDVAAERQYRKGLQHSSDSAAMLGDPLPGYSALDQKMRERNEEEETV